MSKQTKPLPPSPYNLSAVSKGRTITATQTRAKLLAESPYSLRKDSSLAALRPQPNKIDREK